VGDNDKWKMEKLVLLLLIPANEVREVMENPFCHEKDKEDNYDFLLMFVESLNFLSHKHFLG
jgi:hypothetical protein